VSPGLCKVPHDIGEQLVELEEVRLISCWAHVARGDPGHLPRQVVAAINKMSGIFWQRGAMSSEPLYALQIHKKDEEKTEIITQ